MLSAVLKFRFNLDIDTKDCQKMEYFEEVTNLRLKIMWFIAEDSEWKYCLQLAGESLYISNQLLSEQHRLYSFHPM